MSQQASELTGSDSNCTSGEYIEVVHTPVVSPADAKSSSKKDANDEVTSSKGPNEPLLNKESVDDNSEALPSISLGTSEDRWSSGILGLLAHLSQVLGHGNLIHFPYLCAKHGGAAFFVPYILAYICVGIPVLYAEMLLGQFSSSPSTQIFRQLSPALSGIAVAMFAVVLYRSLFFSALIAQLFYAGATSTIGFWSDVPGAMCDPDTQTSLCRDFGYQRFCRAFQHYPGKNVPVCSHNSTLELVDSASSVKTLVPPHTDYMFGAVFKPEIDPMKMQFAPVPVVTILFIVWLITAYLSYRGVKEVSKGFVILKMISVGVVFVNMIIGVSSTQKGDGGVSYFFYNGDFRTLLSAEPWTDAISHVLFSLSLGDGTVHKISSHSKFNENFLFNAIIVSVADILLSLFAGVTFFASIGKVSANLYGTEFSNLRINQVLKNGFAFSMTAFPEHAIASLSDVWATLSTSAHYFTLAKSALANLVMYCNLLVSAISTALSYWYKIQNAVLANALITASVAFFCFLSSLIFIAPAGIFISNLLAEFTNTALLVICLAEILTLIHSYGFRRLLVNLETMILEDSKILATSYSAIGIWYYCLTPAFLIITICLKLVCNNRAVMNGQQFSYLFEGFGWLIFSSCVITIPAIIIAYAIVFRFKPGVIATTFEPTSFWGPANLEDREKNIKNERAIKIKEFKI